MIYKCKFKFRSYLSGEFVALEFNENIGANYFRSNKGKVDIEVSLLFVDLLLYKPTASSGVGELLSAVMDNVEVLSAPLQDKKAFYRDLSRRIGDRSQI